MKDFTHYGWVFGVVPVYVNMTDLYCPIVTERHWLAVPVFKIMNTLFQSFNNFMSMINVDFEAHYTIRLTGEI
tara:strand:- start:18525 stop:18743 length:219 start_codon:yes stop_codon:yes gene_type:complete